MVCALGNNSAFNAPISPSESRANRSAEHASGVIQSLCSVLREFARLVECLSAACISSAVSEVSCTVICIEVIATFVPIVGELAVVNVESEVVRSGVGAGVVNANVYVSTDVSNEYC